MKESATILIEAGAVRDARGVDARPGVVALRDGEVVAAGAPAEVQVKGEVRRIALPDRLVLPALVNAHAHLGLTRAGPRPYGGDFARWLEEAIALTPRMDVETVAAVTEGVAMSRRAGVGHLGDIAGSAAGIGARIEAGLPGVSFLECFGLGSLAEATSEDLRQLYRSKSPPFDMNDPRVHVGVQPHAPYSAGLQLYRAVTALSQDRAVRLSTHLAETKEELEFIYHGRGPLADLLKRLDRWDESITGRAVHPIDYLKEVLKRGRWLLAHCNYVDDHHIPLLAKVHASVAYCPVASDYFGHRHHRYREMLAAGVNVCLGTDSILCQSDVDGTSQLLGILPQMRYLYRRDRTNPDRLLRMATINGMLALSLHEHHATLNRGAPDNLIAVRFDPDSPVAPLTQVLENDHPVEPVDLSKAKLTA